MVQLAVSKFSPLPDEASIVDVEQRKTDIVAVIKKLLTKCNPPTLPPVPVEDPQYLPAIMDSGATTAPSSLVTFHVMCSAAACARITSYSTQPATQIDGRVIRQVQVGNGDSEQIVGRANATIEFISYKELKRPGGASVAAGSAGVSSVFTNVHIALIPGLCQTLVATSLFTQAGTPYTEWPNHLHAPINCPCVHTITTGPGGALGPNQVPMLGAPIIRAYRGGAGDLAGVNLVGMRILDVSPPNFDPPRLVRVTTHDPGNLAIGMLTAHRETARRRSAELASFRQGRR